MKRNRRVTKKMSVMAVNTMRFGSIIVCSFVMVIINMLADSSCTQLMRSLGSKEKELAKLEDSRMREASRWEGMKTPEKLEMALLKHGLSMKLPRPDQNVRMRSDGTPYPAQIAVAKAKASYSATVADSRVGTRRPNTSASIPYRRKRR